MKVSAVSHDVLVNQLSSPAYSILESLKINESEPYLKELPNQSQKVNPRIAMNLSSTLNLNIS